VELVGAEKGCRWVAAAERAEAACDAEEMKAAAHAAGGTSLTPKLPSCNGRWSWRLVAVGFNPAVWGSGWPKCEGSMAKICSVLLEVQAGCSPWNCSGEILEL
jgi:hypothetical protein